MDPRSFFGRRRAPVVVIRRRRPAVRRARTVVVKGVPKRASKAIAKIANRVVRRNLETKQMGTNPAYNYTGLYGSTLPVGGVPQLFTCVPQIQQGDTAETRSGNKISPTSHFTDIRFTFNPDAVLQYTPPGGTLGTYPISQAGWDITVHIWYGYIKRFNRVDWVVQNQTTILQEFFQNSEGDAVSFSGLSTDELLKVDKDQLVMKHKSFRMYKNAGLANVGDTVSPSLTTPMVVSKQVRLSWKAPKTLTYATDDALIPENYAPFFIVGYVHNDATDASDTANTGATADLTRIPAIQMCQVDHLFYKDG